MVDYDAPQKLSSSLTIQTPLSRRGEGPGLVILTMGRADDDQGIEEMRSTTVHRETLDPVPLQKWAEEGYAVAQLELGAKTSRSRLGDELRAATTALATQEKCTGKSAFGLIVHFPESFPDLTDAINESSEIQAVVSYGALPGTTGCAKAHVAHLAEKGAAKTKTTAPDATTFRYGAAASPAFVLPGHADFVPASAAVAHTRSLDFLKHRLGGPWFDLEAVWEEHTRFEFETRSVEDTMATMVAEPYVNHVPTMTGGVGRRDLARFYRHHFIFANPDDAAMELVSRTVGVDRVVDEFIFTLTHTKAVDWLAPGIPPTGRKLRIPFMAVVNIRGDRLCHEHITWDGLTVLVQLGLMPAYLPFPGPLANDAEPAPGHKFEYRVPGAGQDVAAKVLDESSVPSNEMLEFSVRQVLE